jgi:hypothetical protein
MAANRGNAVRTEATVLTAAGVRAVTVGHGLIRAVTKCHFINHFGTHKCVPYRKDFT